MGAFDEDRFERLKETFEENLNDGPTTQFEFEGQTLVRSYARYLLQYLSPLLGFGEYKEPDMANKAKPPVPILKGSFAVANGKLDFVCETKHVSFAEVKTSLLKLRAEIDRQLDNENSCPFYTPPPPPSKKFDPNYNPPYALRSDGPASTVLADALENLYHGFNIGMLGVHEERFRKIVINTDGGAGGE